MADVQLQNGYIKIANELFNQLFIRDFSPIQLRVLLLLIRISYGCNKKVAIIKPQNLFNSAYIYECDIKRELKHLERNKVIFCDYENKIFAVNKNFDEWKIPYHKLFDEEKFAKLLHINLCCEQRNNFVEDKVFEEMKNETLLPAKKNLCCEQRNNFVEDKVFEEMKNETLLPAKKNLCCEQRNNFVEDKVFEAENTDTEQKNSIPKESIKESIKKESLSHELEEGEREILFDIIKKNKSIENPLAYLRTIIANGDYKFLLKEHEEKKKNAPPALSEIVLKATDKRAAALIICNHGNGGCPDFSAQPVEIQNLLQKYGFFDWNDAYNYEMKIEAEEREQKRGCIC